MKYGLSISKRRKGDDPDWTYLEDQDGNTVAQVLDNRIPSTGSTISQRIVACVNAAIGIEDPEAFVSQARWTIEIDPKLGGDP